ncbi:MAG TPA: glycerol-3-phosphate 1-O-acyltransferase PlsY [Gammaproteobacteria bacterium]
MTMTLICLSLAGLLFGYLLGSLSTAIILCKLMRLPDPRSQGSGNPGATNMLRIGGKKAAIITLLGDALKGLLPALAAVLVINIQSSLSEATWLPAVAGLGAFLGHLYPVFFGFKGGKGVATAFGVLGGVAWPVLVLTGLTWLIVAFISRYSALAGLTAFALAPVYALYVSG